MFCERPLNGRRIMCCPRRATEIWPKAQPKMVLGRPSICPTQAADIDRMARRVKRYLEHHKHEDVLEPEGHVDDTGQVAEFGAPFPPAPQRSDERGGQDERGSDQVSHTQMLDQQEMIGSQFDAIVPNVGYDARVGADGEDDQQGQQSGLTRPVQDRHWRRKVRQHFHGNAVAYVNQTLVIVVAESVTELDGHVQLQTLFAFFHHLHLASYVSYAN